MTAAPPLQAPPGDPAERRKFQLTNLDGNSNKWYLVETWPLPDGRVFFRATYGRVGAQPQVDEKIAPPAWVERKIREKLGKGYQEVALHRPAVVAAAPAPTRSIPRQVELLVDQIFAEAGEKIASYLAVGVDALSDEQIDRGRKLLALAQGQHSSWTQSSAQAGFELLAGTVQRFYNTIPTQLPSRIDRQQVVLDFCKAFDEQENRLNQLEAAIATMAAQRVNPQVSPYETLGAEIEPLAEGDQRQNEIRDYIARTLVHGYKVKVREVFTLRVPEERRAFAQNQLGQSRVELLFHGTAGPNVRHILRGGLICPRTPSNGRMMGHGIYFANMASKSINYCASRRRGAPLFLLLAEVAVGRTYLAPEPMSDLREPPRGYDSVTGKAGFTGAWGGKLQFDEIIVYKAQQQTLRYLVTFDRA